MNTKETWIRDTENSLEGLRQAEATPYLHTRIQSRLQASRPETVPASAAWISMASLLVLILLNLLVIIFRYEGPKGEAGDLQGMSVQLRLMNTNPVNYN